MSRVPPLPFNGAAAALEQDTPPAALETEHLRVRYGNRLVLDDISLRMAKGRITA